MISLFVLVVTIPFEAMLMAKEKFGIYALISVIDVIVKLKVGEYVKISNKKHQILSVEFHCKHDLPKTENNIEELSSACGSIAEIGKNNVKINLPIVTD